MAVELIDWTQYPNFTAAEFTCKHTGLCLMSPEYLKKLQAIRSIYGKPMRITSGYRHPTHPIEAAKKYPGEHSTGRASDVAISGKDALELISIALSCGMTRLGVQQKGRARFLHLGDSPEFISTVWSY